MTRDVAIDATRGLAIWSMISFHFAAYTYVAAPTHAFPFVDGMSAFVLLSGLVLGMVYRRWVTRHSLAYAYRRLVRRLAVLYVCQVAIALVAVAAALAGHRWLTLLLPIDGWGAGLWHAVTLRYLPSGGNILRLYLVLLASAFVLVPLLARGRWRPIVAGSAVLYVISQVAAPDWFYLASDMASPRTENWAAWQIVFVPAMVIGWNWQRWRVADRIDRFLPLIVGAAVVAAMAFRFFLVDGAFVRLQVPLADKVEFGPVRAAGAWLAVPAIYGVFRLALRSRYAERPLRPLVMTGARSLDSYVLQSIALIVVPIHIAHRPWDLRTSLAVTLLVFGACWGWAELRRGCGIDKLHRLPVILLARLRPAPPARPGVPVSPVPPPRTVPERVGAACTSDAASASGAALPRVRVQPDSQAVPSPSLSRSAL